MFNKSRFNENVWDLALKFMCIFLDSLEKLCIFFSQKIQFLTKATLSFFDKVFFCACTFLSFCFFIAHVLQLSKNSLGEYLTQMFLNFSPKNYPAKSDILGRIPIERTVCRKFSCVVDYTHFFTQKFMVVPEVVLK